MSQVVSQILQDVMRGAPQQFSLRKGFARIQHVSIYRYTRGPEDYFKLIVFKDRDVHLLLSGVRSLWHAAGRIHLFPRGNGSPTVKQRFSPMEKAQMVPIEGIASCQISCSKEGVGSPYPLACIVLAMEKGDTPLMKDTSLSLVFGDER